MTMLTSRGVALAPGVIGGVAGAPPDPHAATTVPRITAAMTGPTARRVDVTRRSEGERGRGVGVEGVHDTIMRDTRGDAPHDGITLDTARVRP